MYNKAEIYISNALNPYHNLAIEAVLTDCAREGELTVFLWRNDNTVVIGRHQNAYLDVCVARLAAEGGLLARRLTGGGAVYHDRGNLNFSFITGKKGYNLSENNALVLGAVAKLGLAAEVSGRNDLTISGRKFSGNAYLKTKTAALHHGTVLIHTDRQKMTECLSVSPDKLKGKGVSSVGARVVNLSELNPNINVESVTSAIVSAVQDGYSDTAIKEISLLPQDEISMWEEFFGREEFIYGKKVKLQTARYKRFEWGYADIHFTITAGRIEEIAVFSDALDVKSVDSAIAELRGARVAEGYKGGSHIARDIMGLITDGLNN